MGSVRFAVVRGVGAVLLFLFCLVSAPLWAGETYLLAEGDEVRVIAPDLPGLAGVDRLGEGGRIALPMAAEVRLGGLDLQAAAKALRSAVAAEVVAPRVGLELVAQRPFFILGDVASPGAYPASPGLTVGRAVARAGGLCRPNAASALQAVSVDIRAREEFARAKAEHAALTLRALRLEAALAGAVEIAIPVSFATDPRLGDVIARERSIHAATRAAFEARARSIADLLAARAEEIAALEGRLAGAARQTAQIAQEVADARALLERGLAPVARLNGLLREADRHQGEVLQITMQLAQARQAAAQLEVERVNFPRERAVADTERLLETRARLAVLEQSITAARDLIAAGGMQGGEGEGLPLRVTIEGADGARRVLPAGEDAVIRAGDLVTVWRRDLPRGGDW